MERCISLRPYELIARFKEVVGTSKVAFVPCVSVLAVRTMSLEERLRSRLTLLDIRSGGPHW